MERRESAKKGDRAGVFISSTGGAVSPDTFLISAIEAVSRVSMAATD